MTHIHICSLSEQICTIPTGIHRLPNEILGDIFFRAIEPLNWQSMDGFGHPGSGMGFEPHRIVSSQRNNRPIATQCKLRAICKGWKHVVESTPRIWTTLTFDRRLPSNGDVIESIFDRSQACKLNIYLEVQHLRDSHHLFYLIAKHSFRIEAMMIVGAHFRWTGIILSKLFPLRGLTQLKTFGLQQFPTRWDNDPNELVLDAPGLEELFLVRSRQNILFSIPMNSLRHVTISLDNLHRLSSLSTCPNLETVNFPKIRDLEPPVIEGIITLSTVRNIKLGSDPTIFQWLCDHLRLPALTSVDIRGEDTSSSDMDTVLHRFAGFLGLHIQLPKVTSFQLTCIKYARNKRMKDIFRCLPHLYTLRFRSCPFIGNILGILAPDSESGIVMCRHLAIVILQDLKYNTHDFRQLCIARAAAETVTQLQIQIIDSVEVVDAITRDVRDSRGNPIIYGGSSLAS
ncbi:hypothetical protein BU17DRAFT_70941 [Hysterangium stoloniferum]|nr:hypothetical protein BU17DRAFT_70941 [Hysterangium stoloniferum]